MVRTRKSEKGKRLGQALAGLQLFIGLGGVAGGLGLVLNPLGENLGFSLDLLEQSPFTDYLIPGLVLLVVNGCGSLLGAFFSLRRLPRAGEIAVVLGVFLMGWILPQVYWIGYLHWLQPLYLGFGLLEVALGVLLCQRRLEG